MLLSPRKNGLDSLFTEVRVFKVVALRLPRQLKPSGEPLQLKAFSTIEIEGA